MSVSTGCNLTLPWTESTHHFRQEHLVSKADLFGADSVEGSPSYREAKCHEEVVGEIGVVALSANVRVEFELVLTHKNRISEGFTELNLPVCLSTLCLMSRYLKVKPFRHLTPKACATVSRWGRVAST